MRDSITVLAILLIVVLTAALVGPYFIDWNSHRAFIESRLTEAAGAPVTIAGAIEVRLLPQPTFRLADVTVGQSSPGQQSLTAARLDAQVSLTGLMRGDIQVTEATLQRPRVDLSAAPNGSVPISLPAIADPQRIQVQHVAIVDGTLTIADPDGRTITVSGLDLDGEATSLLGPLKFNGHFGSGRDRHAFRLSTGAYDRGKLRLKLGVDGAGALPTVDLDGTVMMSATAPRAGLHFDGSLLLTGAIPLPDTPATIPWRLTTALDADRDRIGIADLELRAGADLRGLVATGTGEASFSDRPDVKVRAHASQINADTLAVVPDGSTVAPPVGVDLLARLVELAQDPAAAVSLPVRLDLDYAVDSASAGAKTIFGIAGRLKLDGDAQTAVRFAASGPEGSRVAIDGGLEGGTLPVFRGRLEAGVRDVARFGDWLSPALPGVANWIKRKVPARSAAFAGSVDLSAVGGAARDATLTLDGTSLTGNLSYTEAVGNERARLFADLRAGALILDDLPTFDGSSFDWADLDLDLAFAASSVTIAAHPNITGTGGQLDAGQIALRVRKSGPDATLDRLSADFGSATLRASGSIDAGSAKTQVLIDAPDLAPIADLLAHVAPGRGTALLQARAAVLSPARLSLSLDASRGRDGSLLPEVISITGRANGTDLDAELKPDRPGDLDPATAIVTARLLARAPQSLVLLRQLGLPLAAGDPRPVSADQAQFDARAHGSFSAGFETMLDAQLGGAVLAYRGRAKPDLGSGHLSLKGNDLLPVLKGAGLMAASATGPLPLQGEADLSWHDSNVALRRLGGQLAGTVFTGDLNTDLAPSSSARSRPVLFGTLSLDRVDLATLFGLALGVAQPGDPSDGVASESWSDQPFGAVPLQLPRTEIAIKAGLLGLETRLQARTASFTLKTDVGAFTLADLTGKLNGGNLGGSLTLRRDGAAAALAGTVSLSDIGVMVPGGVAAKLGGSIDLAGTGTSPSTLVASLAGRGSVIVADASIAGADPSALPRAAHASEQNTSEVDADQVQALLSAELGQGSLPVGNVAGPASLVAGLLRLGPLHTEGDGWTSETEAAIDLRTLSGSLKASIKERQPLPDWKGDPAQIGIAIRDLPGTPTREVDAIGFVNALQARAIARDQERIDIIQQDIRERAAFNRRLKVIEADQKAARDRAKSDADARSAADLERLLDQERLNSFDIPPLKPSAGPVAPASGGPSTGPAKAPRSTPAGRAASSPPPSPRPRGLPRMLTPTPNGTQGPLKGPGPPDPAIEGRY